MPQFRGVPTIKLGDVTSPSLVIDLVIKRLQVALTPKFREICEWYKEQVSSFQYAYFDGYPFVIDRMRPIIKNATPKIEFVKQGNRIQFRIKVFDDAPGGYLDQETDTGRGSIGWWRYFEEGAPGQRNFGSKTHGFIVTGRKPDGRPDGFMVPAYSRIINGVLKPRPHPGVYRVGVFEATWNAMKNEFTRRVAEAVQQALLEI